MPTTQFSVLACQVAELLLIFMTLILTWMESKTENPTSPREGGHPFTSTTEPSDFPSLPQTDGELSKVSQLVFFHRFHRWMCNLTCTFPERAFLAVTLLFGALNLLRLSAQTYIGGWKLLRKANFTLEWFLVLLSVVIDSIELYYIGDSFSNNILLFVNLLSACCRIFLCK